MIEPRPYQRIAKNAVMQYFLEKQPGHPLLVLPTGSGKSIILGMIIEEFYKKYPSVNILVVSHTKEILVQDARAIRKFVPHSNVGIYSSGLKRRQHRKYTVAGIQSIWRRADEFKNYQLIIVDEAHLIPAEGEGRYRTFLGAMPDAKVLGLTATPYRLGHGYITDGHIFDKIVYHADMVELIEDGYLANLSTKDPGYTMDTSDVTVVAGEFNNKQLSAKLDNRDITNTILDNVVTYKDKRRKWLIFAIDIDHAENIAEELTKRGIKCAAVHSKLDFDRKYLLDLFRHGFIQALVNVETLTTGFDVPDIDMIVLMRPTHSPVLHSQMNGRGMRVAEGKKDCLVLDFAGNIARLGPINDPIIPQRSNGRKKKKEGNGNPLTKVCPDCQEIVAIKTEICPACDYKFPKLVKLQTRADSGDIISKDNSVVSKIITMPVDSVTYALHKKAGKKPSLKVTYRHGLRIVNVWQAFEHTGYARYKAMAWWKQHALSEPPDTVIEALTRKHELAIPSEIMVDTSGKYQQILRYVFK